MHTSFLDRVFAEGQEQTAILWRETPYTFSWLERRKAALHDELTHRGIRPGQVVALEGDFSPNTIALLLALIDINAIIVPLAIAGRVRRDEQLEIARSQLLVIIDENDAMEFMPLAHDGERDLYSKVRKAHHPGLVLFTSGSTAAPKAAVHDFTGLLEKFHVRRPALTTMNFLLFDHWGGLNTMFYALSNGATLVTVDTRTPDRVCELIEKSHTELLPASPTFLNLLLVSEAYKRYDLKSLKVISYGTEAMPQSTLNKLAMVFPDVKLQQTYGLIELGVLRSKSKDSESLWVKVGGEGYKTRIRNGMLEIKAKSAMLGYLNAPSPFTEDGWFMTGDAVEEDGEFIRILGRKSELINVGGEKVYPAEVESVIQDMDNIVEVTVYGEQNAIMGNIVCARVLLRQPEDSIKLSKRIKTYCRKHLQPYKVPVRVTITDGEQFSGRFKKMRRQNI